ncbi:sn-glycerol 3-phosphate transport system substrate-binding protein [Kaistia soli DSM 19436]|uniref:sn-glycerol-3-phosphate-binding periplasmic protein UgpB n=1 Tax=Kaistia soli DSM 19436 TaxID=1122133 RepID=A0A1M5LN99_9HYPH|nr:extracellular solute-binding protein [Kaistia soli]SHG66564.1 sn-glycerol 3-phosphate transport system substrate-binding protein [Kaistia soli DSM 19436]
MHAKFLGAAGMFAIAAMLAGPAMADKTKIDFWFGNTGDIAKRVQEQCDRFNQSQSDYEVVCTSQGSYDASLQNTIAAFRAGKQPTIAQVSDAGTLDIMLSGAFYPAKKLMADMGYAVDWDDYFSGIRSYYATSKGDMYSFPFNSSTPLLYWNKDAFAKIGKDHAPATWEEAAEDFKALKAAGYACPLGFNISRDEIWQYGEQFMAVHGEPIATKRNGYDGLDAELIFNKGKWVQYVKNLKSWYDNGEAVLKSKETGQTFVEAFAAGDCQVILTSVGDHGNIGRTAKPGMNWDVAMLPVYAGTERKHSFVGGASLWVLAGKSDAEYKGAAAFFNFIAKPEEALTWSTVTGYIPVRNSGYDYLVKQGFYDKAPYAGRELAIKSLTASPATADSLPGIRLGGLLQIRQEMANGLQAIFINNADVQASLDDAAARGNQILRRFEQTYKGKQLP